MHQIASETNQMMLSPEEVPSEIQLTRRIQNSDGTIFIARSNKYSVGYCTIKRGLLIRNHGVGSIVMGVAKEHRGKGVGNALADSVIEWAKSKDLYRIEFDVHTTNTASISLFTKKEFFIEGLKRKCALIDGHYVDKFLMARLL
jgi:RimJ/RimL family protein N-acetyltransferase